MLLEAQDVCLKMVHEVADDDVLENLAEYASQREWPVV